MRCQEVSEPECRGRAGGGRARGQEGREAGPAVTCPSGAGRCEGRTRRSRPRRPGGLAGPRPPRSLSTGVAGGSPAAVSARPCPAAPGRLWAGSAGHSLAARAALPAGPVHSGRNVPLPSRSASSLPVPLPAWPSPQREEVQDLRATAHPDPEAGRSTPRAPRGDPGPRPRCIALCSRHRNRSADADLALCCRERREELTGPRGQGQPQGGFHAGGLSEPR